MLLPGQERAVFTKETLIMNVMSETLFDNFYLGWALDLDAVRKQWNRVVFMRTNRRRSWQQISRNSDSGSRHQRTWRIGFKPLPQVLSFNCAITVGVFGSAKSPK